MFEGREITRYRTLLVVLVGIVGGGASIALWYNTLSGQQHRLESEFQRRALEHANRAAQHLSTYPQSLSHFQTVGVLPRDTFRAVLENNFRRMLHEHQSVSIMEWVPEITHDQRARFEENFSRTKGRPMVIQSRQPDGSFLPAEAADYYYPIQTALPLSGNEGILLYDLRSAPTLASLEKARETRRMVATPQFTLAQSQGPDDSLAVNLIMPVFGQSTDAADERFRGFVQCIISVSDSLHTLHANTGDKSMFITYEDVSAQGDERRILYANRAGQRVPVTVSQDVPPPPAVDSDRPDHFAQTFDIGGREWRFTAVLNPAWAATQQTFTPWLILGGGMGTTALLGLLFNGLFVRNQQIEKTVARRTRELNDMRLMLERDITRRVIAEKSWRENAALVKGLLTYSTSEIFIKDRKGRYILFNQTYEKALGRSHDEIYGKTDADLFPADLQMRFIEGDQKVISTKKPIRYESILEFRGRERVDIVQKFPILDEEGQVTGVGGIVLDITERAHAEKLRQDYERKMQASQKMESLGVLAGGIAHDFNNILATILGQVELLRRAGAPDEAQAEKLQRIELASRRASDLCEQMLTYAGQGSLETSVLDLNEVLTDSMELLNASLPKTINLRKDDHPNLPRVQANKTQMRQVVMNLVINAADAMADGNGEIHLRTVIRELTAAELEQAMGHPDLPPGRYVGLVVSDNGPGIEPADQERVFEPFYSTKFQGRGLGLSTVLGVAQTHHGALFLESNSGEGATFTLLLPATETPEAALAEAADSADPFGLSGAALVVDDEPEVRDVAVGFLETEGMTVFTAVDGATALDVFGQHHAAIDVILLDLSMPGLSGAETLHRLREINPNVPVIVLSGYNRTSLKTPIDDLPIHAFVQKPYSFDTLHKEIARALKQRK